jgi:hypothetical protein
MAPTFTAPDILYTAGLSAVFKLYSDTSLMRENVCSDPSLKAWEDAVEGDLEKLSKVMIA